LVTLVVTAIFLGSLTGLADEQEEESPFRYRLVGYGKVKHSWPGIASAECNVDIFVMKNGTVGDFGGQTILHFKDGSTLEDYERPICVEVNEATREVWLIGESTTRPGISNGHLAIAYFKDGGPNGVDLWTGQSIPEDWTREKAIDLCKQRPDFETLILFPASGAAFPMPLLEGDLELIIYDTDTTTVSQLTDTLWIHPVVVLASVLVILQWRRKQPPAN
ncbi:MAG: hypothetical protein ACFFCW_25705, partial [Candidatus Hodarchaeota archaeon]